jgi:hypothetical protein
MVVGRKVDTHIFFVGHDCDVVVDSSFDYSRKTKGDVGGREE